MSVRSDPQSLYPDRSLLAAEHNLSFLRRCVSGFPRGQLRGAGHGPHLSAHRARQRGARRSGGAAGCGWRSVHPGGYPRDCTGRARRGGSCRNGAEYLPGAERLAGRATGEAKLRSDASSASSRWGSGERTAGPQCFATRRLVNVSSRGCASHEGTASLDFGSSDIYHILSREKLTNWLRGSRGVTVRQLQSCAYSVGQVLCPTIAGAVPVGITDFVAPLCCQQPSRNRFGGIFAAASLISQPQSVKNKGEGL